MATASRFNRPYASNTTGDSAWTRLQKQEFGADSLANRAATPSGRGYYDPARILERVARGRPGTTMQQAAAAREAYGMDVVNKLLSQPQKPTQGNRLSRGREEVDVGVTLEAPVPQGAQLQMGISPQAAASANQFLGAFKSQQPQQKRGGIGSYLDMMTQGWNALGAAARPFGL